MPRRLLFAALLSLVLLPASCACGALAGGMRAARIDPHMRSASGGAGENLLWLAALALMIVWAWAAARLLGRKEVAHGEGTPTRTDEEDQCSRRS